MHSLYSECIVCEMCVNLIWCVLSNSEMNVCVGIHLTCALCIVMAAMQLSW